METKTTADHPGLDRGAEGVGCLRGALIFAGLIFLLFAFMGYRLLTGFGGDTEYFGEEVMMDDDFEDDFSSRDAEFFFADGVDDAEYIDETYYDTRRPWGTYDTVALGFSDMPAPTFEAHLAALGNDRIREIEFFLPAGDGPIEFAIRNPEPIAIDGQGIAVRTDGLARILYSSQVLTVERPAECYDGNCRLFMWLTMGPTFLEYQPDAELLIWAGEGAQVTIENMPMANIRDETFR